MSPSLATRLKVGPLMPSMVASARSGYRPGRTASAVKNVKIPLVIVAMFIVVLLRVSGPSGLENVDLRHHPAEVFRVVAEKLEIRRVQDILAVRREPGRVDEHIHRFPSAQRHGIRIVVGREI